LVLVDGGVLDRVPAALAKEMGADIIIAVDVCKGNNNIKPKNLFEIILQSIEAMENTLVENMLTEDYIVISPIIKNINPLDFSKVDLCIEEGERAALEVMPSIINALSAYQSDSA